jgi:hypothetical protein
MSAETKGDVAAQLGTNCNLEKTIASVCPAWRCPHHLTTSLVFFFIVLVLVLVSKARAIKEGLAPWKERVTSWYECYKDFFLSHARIFTI